MLHSWERQSAGTCVSQGDDKGFWYVSLLGLISASLPGEAFTVRRTSSLYNAKAYGYCREVVTKSM